MKLVRPFTVSLKIIFFWPALQNFTADEMSLVVVTPPNSNGWNIPLSGLFSQSQLENVTCKLRFYPSAWVFTLETVVSAELKIH